MPSRAAHFVLIAAIASALMGCSAIPDVRSQPKFHNPFPQLQRVAVLPFVNQSQEPTLDTDVVTVAYHNELQKLPGFEVKPLGVVKTQLQAMGVQFNEATNFQTLAQHLDVDVVIVGAVTEFTPYYPPRMAMRVHWYSANPGFHPIPPGYGLPWGTAEEEFIPDQIVHEAEFALAREQLKTQTPAYARASMPKRTPPPTHQIEEEIPAPKMPAAKEPDEEVDPMAPVEEESPLQAIRVAFDESGPIGSGVAESEDTESPEELPLNPPDQQSQPDPQSGAEQLPEPSPLPPDWPDPRGFIPEGPQPSRPELIPQPEPIITHTRMYDGSDDDFTRRVSEYFYFRDDARFGGWQAYLQRSDDFISVCCHFHVTETLAARGGAGKSRVVWRWPIGRYER